MQKYKILILGGTRFIGAFFTEKLMKFNHDVYLSSRRINRLVHNENQEVNERENLVNGRFHKIEFDYIFDFNGYKPNQIIDFKLKSDKSKYVFLSSAWIGRNLFEKRNNGDATKVGLLDLSSYEYTLNKINCEKKIIDLYPNNARIIRLPIIIGEKDPHQRIQYMIQRMLKNNKIAVPDIKNNQIEISVVDDVVVELLKIVNSDEKYEFTDTKIVFKSYIELIHEIILVLNTENKIENLSERDYLNRLPKTSSADPFWRETSSTKSLLYNNERSESVMRLHNVITKCLSQNQLKMQNENAIIEEKNYAF